MPPRNASRSLASPSGIGLAALAAMLFSSSSVFVRLAEPIAAYEITFWRMVIAAATAGVGLLVFARGQRLPRERRYVWIGLAAALHFLLFVAALGLTTIAHALSIVYLAPAIIALASWRWLGEELRGRQIAGIAIALVGIAILVGFEPKMDRQLLAGDAAAFGSACCFAAYSIAGREERLKYRLLPYATAVYGIAALWLLPAFAISFVTGLGATAYTPSTVPALAASGIVPLGLGHTFYNASLRRIPATFANLIASQEVTGGVILGAIILHELPPANAVAGAVLALAGITLVLWEV
ncbi:MAG TPA: DMT family transporter [Chloroflexota bacterium]|nr:DMT family transporter [Chloroflexota bacterium]